MQMFKTFLGLFLVFLFLTSIMSCKNEDSDDDTIPITTIDKQGGVFKLGQLEIIFPENSVSEEIIIGGSIEEIVGIPENLTQISAIHKIDISNPSAYLPNSATIGINHNDDNEVISLFVSNDGIIWTNLGGFIHEEKIKAEIPHFSYFFAGNATYSITVENNSIESESLYIYQYDELISNIGNIFPVVMMSATIPSFVTSRFDWIENFIFWSSTGQLVEGDTITTDNILNADQTTNNLVTLTNQNDSYILQSEGAGQVPGQLIIQVSGNIPISTVICGIGYQDMPTYAVEALPNSSIVFNPTSDEYFIGLGNMVAGQLLNPSVQPSADIEFPSGMYNANVVMTNSQDFTISYY